jgi:hypothetical protein
MFRYMSLIALFLWATCSNAVVQNSDFWFHDEGDTIFINGARGAPLHIDYIGAPLTRPLTVRVASDNPQLKVTPPTCTFTKKDDDCRLTVRLENGKQKVYGVNHFTVTEVGASQGALKAQAASDTSTVGFGVGVQGKDMPKPIPWSTGYGTVFSGTKSTGPVIIANRTNQTRDYQSPFNYGTKKGKSPIYTLSPGRICYLEKSIGQGYPEYNNDALYLLSSIEIYGTSAIYISDMTDPHAPIYNGPIKTGNNNITTCSANGTSACASNKWDSWTVALANLSGTDLDSDVFKAGQIQILQNNTWGNGATLYYKSAWNPYSVGLILIQGSVDGSGFDPNAAAPSLLEIQSAPPCSNYTTDPSVTFNVRLKIYGPGSVSMPGNPQCQAFNIAPESFTNCTSSGSRNQWYEITAVPEPGKTFKGWGSDGLCDDTKTTCRFQLTKEVSMWPFFW